MIDDLKNYRAPTPFDVLTDYSGWILFFILCVMFYFDWVQR